MKSWQKSPQRSENTANHKTLSRKKGDESLEYITGSKTSVALGRKDLRTTRTRCRVWDAALSLVLTPQWGVSSLVLPTQTERRLCSPDDYSPRRAIGFSVDLVWSVSHESSPNQACAHLRLVISQIIWASAQRSGMRNECWTCSARHTTLTCELSFGPRAPRSELCGAAFPQSP